MNCLRAQVNFRQLRAETAGNRYLRRFLPASAGIFICGSVYLRPSQVILHAPVLQCTLSERKISLQEEKISHRASGSWIPLCLASTKTWKHVHQKCSPVLKPVKLSAKLGNFTKYGLDFIRFDKLGSRDKHERDPTAVTLHPNAKRATNTILGRAKTQPSIVQVCSARMKSTELRPWFQLVLSDRQPCVSEA